MRKKIVSHLTSMIDLILDNDQILKLVCLHQFFSPDMTDLNFIPSFQGLWSLTSKFSKFASNVNTQIL